MQAGRPVAAAFCGTLTALGLISCASVHQEGGERDWAFAPASRDEPAKLAYGRRSSDDVDLLLWCDAGKRRVLITPVGADDAHFEHVALRSDGAQMAVDLRQDSRLGSVGGVSLDSPLWSALQKSGRLLMSTDGKRELHLDASPSQGRRQIQNFFQVCR